MPDSSVLIAGAGYTGDRLARRLAERGQAVTMLARSPRDVDGTRSVSIDLDEPLAPSTFDGLAAPYDLVYLVPPSATDGDRDARLSRLLDALPQAPRRIVLASTSGVYGDRGGADTDESAPPNPRTERARRRVRLEHTLRAYRAGADTVILRIAGIYGPGRLPIESLKRGEPIIDPAEASPGNRIHVDDLVRACIAALDHPHPPRIVNVADGDHTSSSAFTLAVAEIAGLPAPPTVSRSEAQTRFSAARLSFLNESRRLATSLLTGSRAAGGLGVQLAYPNHRAGIRASLDAG